ncbi:unnamed protein product [Amoebophrya sp. A25]|nr:unnamed protein product [Amoebophrya sp. A25]|eukprot:GSA25T00004717001.1
MVTPIARAAAPGTLRLSQATPWTLALSFEPSSTSTTSGDGGETSKNSTPATSTSTSTSYRISVQYFKGHDYSVLRAFRATTTKVFHLKRGEEAVLPDLEPATAYDVRHAVEVIEEQVEDVVEQQSSDVGVTGGCTLGVGTVLGGSVFESSEGVEQKEDGLLDSAFPTAVALTGGSSSDVVVGLAPQSTPRIGSTTPEPPQASGKLVFSEYQAFATVPRLPGPAQLAVAAPARCDRALLSWETSSAEWGDVCGYLVQWVEADPSLMVQQPAASNTTGSSTSSSSSSTYQYQMAVNKSASSKVAKLFADTSGKVREKRVRVVNHAAGGEDGARQQGHNDDVSSLSFRAGEFSIVVPQGQESRVVVPDLLLDWDPTSLSEPEGASRARSAVVTCSSPITGTTSRDNEDSGVTGGGGSSPSSSSTSPPRKRQDGQENSDEDNITSSTARRSRTAFLWLVGLTPLKHYLVRIAALDPPRQTKIPLPLALEQKLSAGSGAPPQGQRSPRTPNSRELRIKGTGTSASKSPIPEDIEDTRSPRGSVKSPLKDAPSSSTSSPSKSPSEAEEGEGGGLVEGTAKKTRRNLRQIRTPRSADRHASGGKPAIDLSTLKIHEFSEPVGLQAGRIAAGVSTSSVIQICSSHQEALVGFSVRKRPTDEPVREFKLQFTSTVDAKGRAVRPPSDSSGIIIVSEAEAAALGAKVRDILRSRAADVRKTLEKVGLGEGPRGGDQLLHQLQPGTGTGNGISPDRPLRGRKSIMDESFADPISAQVRMAFQLSGSFIGAGDASSEPQHQTNQISSLLTELPSSSGSSNKKVSASSHLVIDGARPSEAAALADEQIRGDVGPDFFQYAVRIPLIPPVTDGDASGTVVKAATGTSGAAAGPAVGGETRATGGAPLDARAGSLSSKGVVAAVAATNNDGKIKQATTGKNHENNTTDHETTAGSLSLEAGGAARTSSHARSDSLDTTGSMTSRQLSAIDDSSTQEGEVGSMGAAWSSKNVPATSAGAATSTSTSLANTTTTIVAGQQQNQANRNAHDTLVGNLRILDKEIVSAQLRLCCVSDFGENSADCATVDAAVSKLPEIERPEDVVASTTHDTCFFDLWIPDPTEESVSLLRSNKRLRVGDVLLRRELEIPGYFGNKKNWSEPERLSIDDTSFRRYQTGRAGESSLSSSNKKTGVEMKDETGRASLGMELDKTSLKNSYRLQNVDKARVMVRLSLPASTTAETALTLNSGLTSAGTGEAKDVSAVGHLGGRTTPDNKQQLTGTTTSSEQVLLATTGKSDKDDPSSRYYHSAPKHDDATRRKRRAQWQGRIGMRKFVKIRAHVTGLQPETQYVFQIAAVTEGDGYLGKWQQISVRTKKIAPTMHSVRLQLHERNRTSLVLKWENPAFDREDLVEAHLGLNKITGYQLRHKRKADTTWARTTDVAVPRELLSSPSSTSGSKMKMLAGGGGGGGSDSRLVHVLDHVLDQHLVQTSSTTRTNAFSSSRIEKTPLGASQHELYPHPGMSPIQRGISAPSRTTEQERSGADDFSFSQSQAQTSRMLSKEKHVYSYSNLHLVSNLSETSVRQVLDGGDLASEIRVDPVGASTKITVTTPVLGPGRDPPVLSSALDQASVLSSSCSSQPQNKRSSSPTSGARGKSSAFLSHKLPSYLLLESESQQQGGSRVDEGGGSTTSTRGTTTGGQARDISSATSGALGRTKSAAGADDTLVSQSQHHALAHGAGVVGPVGSGGARSSPDKLTTPGGMLPFSPGLSAGPYSTLASPVLGIENYYGNLLEPGGVDLYGGSPLDEEVLVDVHQGIGTSALATATTPEDAILVASSSTTCTAGDPTSTGTSVASPGASFGPSGVGMGLRALAAALSLVPASSREPVSNELLFRRETLSKNTASVGTGNDVEGEGGIVSDAAGRDESGQPSSMKQLPQHDNRVVDSKKISLVGSEDGLASAAAPEDVQPWIVSEVGNLTPGASYIFEIAAVTERGVGNFSKEFSFQTLGHAPDISRPVTAVLRPNRVLLSAELQIAPDADNRRLISDLCGLQVRHYEPGTVYGSSWLEEEIKVFHVVGGGTPAGSMTCEAPYFVSMCADVTRTTGTCSGTSSTHQENQKSSTTTSTKRHANKRSPRGGGRNDRALFDHLLENDDGAAADLRPEKLENFHDQEGVVDAQHDPHLQPPPFYQTQAEFWNSLMHMWAQPDKNLRIFFQVSNLQPERKYVFQVAARTFCGVGKWSADSEIILTHRMAPITSLPQLLDTSVPGAGKYLGYHRDTVVRDFRDQVERATPASSSMLHGGVTSEAASVASAGGGSVGSTTVATASEATGVGSHGGDQLHHDPHHEEDPNTGVLSLQSGQIVLTDGRARELLSAIHGTSTAAAARTAVSKLVKEPVTAITLQKTLSELPVLPNWMQDINNNWSELALVFNGGQTFRVAGESSCGSTTTGLHDSRTHFGRGGASFPGWAPGGFHSPYNYDTAAGGGGSVSTHHPAAGTPGSASATVSPISPARKIFPPLLPNNPRPSAGTGPGINNPAAPPPTAGVLGSALGGGSAGTGVVSTRAPVWEFSNSILQKPSGEWPEEAGIKKAMAALPIFTDTTVGLSWRCPLVSTKEDRLLMKALNTRRGGGASGSGGGGGHLEDGHDETRLAAAGVIEDHQEDIAFTTTSNQHDPEALTKQVRKNFTVLPTTTNGALAAFDPSFFGAAASPHHGFNIPCLNGGRNLPELLRRTVQKTGATLLPSPSHGEDLFNCSVFPPPDDQDGGSAASTPRGDGGAVSMTSASAGGNKSHNTHGKSRKGRSGNPRGQAGTPGATTSTFFKSNALQLSRGNKDNHSAMTSHGSTSSLTSHSTSDSDKNPTTVIQNPGELFAERARKVGFDKVFSVDSPPLLYEVRYRQIDPETQRELGPWKSVRCTANHEIGKSEVLLEEISEGELVAVFGGAACMRSPGFGIPSRHGAAHAQAVEALLASYNTLASPLLPTTAVGGGRGVSKKGSAGAATSASNAATGSTAAAAAGTTNSASSTTTAADPASTKHDTSTAGVATGSSSSASSTTTGGRGTSNPKSGRLFETEQDLREGVEAYIDAILGNWNFLSRTWATKILGGMLSTREGLISQEYTGKKAFLSSQQGEHQEIHVHSGPQQVQGTMTQSFASATSMNPTSTSSLSSAEQEAARLNHVVNPLHFDERAFVRTYDDQEERHRLFVGAPGAGGGSGESGTESEGTSQQVGKTTTRGALGQLQPGPSGGQQQNLPGASASVLKMSQVFNDDSSTTRMEFAHRFTEHSSWPACVRVILADYAAADGGIDRYSETTNLIVPGLLPGTAYAFQVRPVTQWQLSQLWQKNAKVFQQEFVKFHQTVFLPNRGGPQQQQLVDLQPATSKNASAYHAMPPVLRNFTIAQLSGSSYLLTERHFCENSPTIATLRSAPVIARLQITETTMTSATFCWCAAELQPMLLNRLRLEGFEVQHYAKKNDRIIGQVQTITVERNMLLHHTRVLDNGVAVAREARKALTAEHFAMIAEGHHGEDDALCQYDGNYFGGSGRAQQPFGHFGTASGYSGGRLPDQLGRDDDVFATATTRDVNRQQQQLLPLSPAQEAVLREVERQQPPWAVAVVYGKLKVVDLESATDYFVKVRAKTAAGVGPWSAEKACKTTLSLRPPAAPQLVYAEAHTLNLSIVLDAEQMQRFRFWEVRLHFLSDHAKKRSPEVSRVVDAAVRKSGASKIILAVDHLDPGNTYQVQVRGVASDGVLKSSWSERSPLIKTNSIEGMLGGDVGEGQGVGGNIGPGSGKGAIVGGMTGVGGRRTISGVGGLDSAFHLDSSRGHQGPLPGDLTTGSHQVVPFSFAGTTHQSPLGGTVQAQSVRQRRSGGLIGNMPTPNSGVVDPTTGGAPSPGTPGLLIGGPGGGDYNPMDSLAGRNYYGTTATQQSDYVQQIQGGMSPARMSRAEFLQQQQDYLTKTGIGGGSRPMTRIRIDSGDETLSAERLKQMQAEATAAKHPKDVSGLDTKKLESSDTSKQLQSHLESILRFVVTHALKGTGSDRGLRIQSISEAARTHRAMYGSTEAAIQILIDKAENPDGVTTATDGSAGASSPDGSGAGAGLAGSSDEGGGGDSFGASSFIGNGFFDNTIDAEKVVDFLVGLVPVVGASSVFLKDLFYRIRNCALIAELYGHDTENDLEAQALILTCLIPGQNIENIHRKNEQQQEGAGPGGTGGEGEVSVGGGGSGSSSSGGGPGGGGGGGFMARSPHAGDMIGSTYGGAASPLYHRDDMIGGGGPFPGGSMGMGRTDEGEPSGPGVENLSDMVEIHELADITGAVARAVVKEVVILASGITKFSRLIDIVDDLVSYKGKGQLSSNQGASPEALAAAIFQPQPRNETPIVLGACLFIWLLPTMLSVTRFLLTRILPVLQISLITKIDLTLGMVLCIVGLTFALSVPVVHRAPRFYAYVTETLSSLPAAIVFGIHAILPGVGCWLGTRDFLSPLLEHDKGGYLLMPLGTVALLAWFGRWCDDRERAALLDETPPPWWIVYKAQALSVRVILYWALIAFFIWEELIARFLIPKSFTTLQSLKLISPDESLLSFQTVYFSLGLLGQRAQEHLFECLTKRTVLLRLLGAKTAIYGGVLALCSGVFAMFNLSATVAFLTNISPTPPQCLVVLVTRKIGVGLGFAIPVAWALCKGLILHAGLPEFAVIFAGASGLAAGVIIMLRYQWEERTHFRAVHSNYRILLLFPHTSRSARDRAEKAMELAMRRTAVTSAKVAGGFVSKNLVRQLFSFGRYVFSGRGGR